jgi:hypothetical protein
MGIQNYEGMMVKATNGVAIGGITSPAQAVIDATPLEVVLFA